VSPLPASSPIVLVLVVVIVIDVFGSEPRTPSLPSFVRVSFLIASHSYRQRSKIDNEHDHENDWGRDDADSKVRLYLYSLVICYISSFELLLKSPKTRHRLRRTPGSVSP
jgi:hypothetical protein